MWGGEVTVHRPLASKIFNRGVGRGGGFPMKTNVLKDIHGVIRGHPNQRVGHEHAPKSRSWLRASPTVCTPLFVSHIQDTFVVSLLCLTGVSKRWVKTTVCHTFKKGSGRLGGRAWSGTFSSHVAGVRFCFLTLFSTPSAHFHVKLANQLVYFE